MLRAIREHVSKASRQHVASKLERRPGASGASFRDLGKVEKPLAIRRVESRDPEEPDDQSTEREHVPNWQGGLRHASAKNLLTRDGEPMSFEELRFQGDVLDGLKPGSAQSRLVDDAQHKHNIKLWVELLELRARLDGQDGVREVWQGMRRRQVDLPTRGTEADGLWAAFCEALTPAEIFAYAQDLHKRTRQSHGGLYTHIVKPLLGNDPQTALAWSRRLKKININGRRSLTQMVDEAIKTPKSLRIFRHLYVRQDWSPLYDKLIPALCERRLHQEALNWHRYLLSVDDTPSYAQAADCLWLFFNAQKDHRICQEIADAFIERDVPLETSVMRRYSTEQTETQSSNVKESSNGQDMVYMPGRSFGPTPAYINDEYASRAFATSTFGLNIITLWLTAFGIETLGPLAMRELAVRCISSEEVLDRIRNFAEKRVKISNHIFCRIIQRAARSGDQALLDSVLQADLHPDVYEDSQTQRKLLRHYMERRDWSQLRRTLFVLTVYHRARAGTAWNFLLLHHMQSKDLPMVQTISNNMVEHGISWTAASVKQSFFLLIPSRKAGKRPALISGSSMDNVMFVTRLWLQILRTGGTVPPQAWRQVYTYFGMEGHMAEVESLSLWLVHHYSKGQSSKSQNARVESRLSTRLKAKVYVQPRRHRQRVPSRSIHDTGDAIKELFPPVRLRAIIEWSMKTLGRPVPASSRRQVLPVHDLQVSAEEGEESTKHWSRGLQLLSVLRRRGVPISENIVRKACVHRFRILFGGEVSSKKENRIAVMQNPYSLSRMVREVNQIWQTPVFKVPVHVLRDEEALKALVLGKPDRRGRSRLLRRPLEPALTSQPKRLRHRVSSRRLRT